jgi:hypothetical protein
LRGEFDSLYPHQLLRWTPFASINGMEQELTAEQACHGHLLAPEDYARMCNQDGSLKSQSKTTTLTIKNTPAKSVTIDNTVFVATIVAISLLLVIAGVLLFRWRKRKK